MSKRIASLVFVLAASLLTGCVGAPPQQGYASATPNGYVTPISHNMRGIPCNVTVRKNGETVRKTVYVASGTSCEELGELVEDARTLGKAAEKTEERPVLPSDGCGITLNGHLVKALPKRDGTTCEADKKAFVAKFKAECYGKSGSDAGDRACGAKLTLD